jgi:hypothetical protein
MKRGFTAVALIAAALSLVGCDKIEKKAATPQTAKADTVKFPIVFECDVRITTAGASQQETIKTFVVLDKGADGLTVRETPGDTFLNNGTSKVVLSDSLLTYSMALKDTDSSYTIDRLTGYYISHLRNRNLFEDGSGTCKVKKDKLF